MWNDEISSEPPKSRLMINSIYLRYIAVRFPSKILVSKHRDYVDCAKRSYAIITFPHLDCHLCTRKETLLESYIFRSCRSQVKGITDNATFSPSKNRLLASDESHANPGLRTTSTAWVYNPQSEPLLAKGCLRTVIIGVLELQC